MIVHFLQRFEVINKKLPETANFFTASCIFSEKVACNWYKFEKFLSAGNFFTKSYQLQVYS